MFAKLQKFNKFFWFYLTQLHQSHGGGQVVGSLTRDQEIVGSIPVSAQIFSNLYKSKIWQREELKGDETSFGSNETN